MRLSEVSGEDFVMYERAYASGFHDLIFGMLRDARIVPNVSQAGAEISTLISLVDAHMGIAIYPISVVKHGVASVKAADGTEQTFEVAGHGTKVAAVDTAKGTEKGAKVTVYYTESAGKKIVHFFEKL